MNKKHINILFSAVLSVFILSSCGSNSTDAQKNQVRDSVGFETDAGVLNFALPDFSDIYEVDIEKTSLQNLRLLRGAVLAKYGEIFAESDLRGYFLSNDKNYSGDMIRRWKSEFEKNKKQAKEGIFSETVLSSDNIAFLAKIDGQIAKLKKNNFVNRNGYYAANIGNIVNFFKFDNLEKQFLQKLAEDNMAVTNENKSRLFDTYIENNSSQIPSFITADLIIQIYAVYLSYVENLLRGKSKDVSFIDSHWTQCLQALSVTNESYPAFMRLSAWQIKNLNASMSARAAFQNRGNRAFLKKEPVERPFSGTIKENNDNPPAAFTVGYVEPNILFWQKISEGIDLTVKVLEKNSLLTADLRRKTNKMKDIAEFLYEAGVKELSGEPFSKQEYERIAWLGDEIQAVTNFFLEKQPDSIASVSVFSKQKDKVLYNALGNARDIYVVVEINGYLYLTKGAVFSFYEFSRLNNEKPLTSEEWEKTVKSGQTPAAPAWIKDYITKFPPVANERIYSRTNVSSTP